MSPFRYQLAMEKSLLHQVASVIDHLSSLGEGGHYIFYFFKALKKTRCTILMHLGQEGCRPSTFGLFANGALKVN